MGPWNRSVQRLQIRSLGLQSLDDRWLPSGFGLLQVSLVEPALLTAQVAGLEPTGASPIAPDGPMLSAASVEVVEIALAPDAEDSEVAVNTPELPNRIVEALNDAFPGWTQVEAEKGTEMGVAEYAVSADWNGVPVELTLTENGQISQLEQDLLPSELPKPFQDWVGKNFPGGETGEAVRVIEPDGVSYDLLIVTASGRKIEATLRYDRIEVQPALPIADPGENERPAAKTGTSGESATLSWAREAEAKIIFQSQTTEIPGSGSQANSGSSSVGAAHPQSQAWGRGLFGVEDVVPQPDASSSAPGPVDESLAVLRDLVVTLAEVGPTALFTPLTGILFEHLPIDAAAVERGLHQFVDGLDSLAENLSSDVDVQGIASWGALIAAFLAGSWLSSRRSRRNGLEPVLGSISASRSWSWIVGAGTTTRS